MLSTNRQATVRKRIRRRGLLAEDPPRAAVLRRPEPPPLPPRRRVGLAGRRAAGPVRALVGRLPPAARPPAGRGVPERAPEGRVPLGRAPEGRPAPRAGCPGAGRPPVPVDAVGAPPAARPAVEPVAALPPVALGVEGPPGREPAGVRAGAEPGRARPEGGGVLRWVTGCSVGVVSRGACGRVSRSVPGRRPVAWSRPGRSSRWWTSVPASVSASPPRACSASLPGCWRRARELSPQGCSSSGPWTR